MDTLKLQRTSETLAQDVFINHGFTRINRDHVKPELIKRFKHHGLNTLSDLYIKDGKTYIFNGWEKDQYGYMANPAKYLEAVEVTNIIKEEN